MLGVRIGSDRVDEPPKKLNKGFLSMYDKDCHTVQEIIKKEFMIDVCKYDGPQDHPPRAMMMHGWMKLVAADRKARGRLGRKLAKQSGQSTQVCTKFLEALPKAVASVLGSSGVCLVPNIVKFKSKRIPKRQPGTTKSICRRTVVLGPYAEHNKATCTPTRGFSRAVVQVVDE